MGPLGELGALFNPGMRHEIEERKSKANRREEEGNARDGDLRIDLASGVAVINIPSRNADGAQAAVTPPQQTETSATATDDQSGVAGDGARTGSTARAGGQARSESSAARTRRGSTSSTTRQARSSTKGDAAKGEAVKPAGTDRPSAVPRPTSKASRAAR